MIETVKTRLTELEAQLAQQITRRAQLEAALKETCTNIERIEGACAFARNLLQASAMPVPTHGNGADQPADEPPAVS